MITLWQNRRGQLKIRFAERGGFGDRRTRSALRDSHLDTLHLIMGNNVFVTGNSAGLGLAFTKHYLEHSWTVFGLSRRGCPLHHAYLRDVQVDLANTEAVPGALDKLLGESDHLDLVILNAGILGDIHLLTQTPLSAIKPVMDINVWANKLILDWLHHNGVRIKQIILMSSGAAVNGNKGWNAYALSKATLNMLTQLYAAEFPDSHLIALAPGLVDTDMQAYLAENVDTEQYPSVARLVAARGTDAMLSANEAVRKIAPIIPTLPTLFDSGSFVDIRKL